MGNDNTDIVRPRSTDPRHRSSSYCDDIKRTEWLPTPRSQQVRLAGQEHVAEVIAETDACQYIYNIISVQNV